MLFMRLRPKISRRFVHNLIFKMDKAYLRHLDEAEKFEITFQYVDKKLSINRQFNFCRQTRENVNNFTQRVATNVEKVVKKKAKNKECDDVKVTIRVNGNTVEEEANCGVVFKNDKDQIILKVCDQEFEVIVNSPWISTLSLPNSLLAGFPIYPSKFECVYTDKTISKCNWLKSQDKKTWSLIGEGYVYSPQNTDIGNFLKLQCVPKKGKLEGPLAEAITNVKVEAGPGTCPFEVRQLFTVEKCQDKIFRVVSYNILADLYADMDYTKEVLHPYCAKYAFNIDYRKQLIIKELKGYNADIICLQEVDRKVYKHDLEPLLSLYNYQSDLCLKREGVAEGVACFFDQSRFTLLETYRMVLSDEFDKNGLFGDIWDKIQLNENLKSRILDRSTVLQVVVLEKKGGGEVLVVGNTHLYFHPDADHIRLLQGAVVGKYMEEIIKQMEQKYKKPVSVILCGDFNSVPSCGIYQLYTTGNVSEDHIDFQSKPEESIKVSLKQSLIFQSACGTPKYTNFTAGFADCLDYIYYQPDNFKVVQVVPFPTEEELREHVALPSVVFPSDHVALIADLEMCS